ncbi:MAG: hypothetical protein FJ109_09625 [Deltaproteobacteria bacterium]|nr:hypothetical protein [Deltaproteobacteria bacterium]
MKKILGLAVVALFGLGLSMAACDSGGDDGNGKDDVKIEKDNNVPPDGDVTVPEEEVVDVCTPACEGKQCGPDGCGGTCGVCDPGIPCQDGVCKCDAVKNCEGKECGPDGCGGECGKCGDGFECNLGTSMCVEIVVPDCEGKECGSDGAGGSCGTCPCDNCEPNEVVCDTVTFQCTVEPDKDCKWIFDCFDTCPEGDQACLQNCVNEASLPAQMAYNNLMQCLSDSGYFDCLDQFPEGSEELEACLEKAFEPCLDYYYECFHGDLDCQEMNQCFNACPEVPEGQPNPCISDCWSSGTVEAQKAYTAIIECLEAQGYWDCAQGDNKCLSDAEAACSAEFDVCFPPGTLTCKEIFDCMDTCAPTDQPCFSNCYQSGTKEAQNMFGEIVDCIIAECGEQATPECEDAALKGTCSQQYNECLGS